MKTLVLLAALAAANPASPLDLSRDLREATRQAAALGDWESARRTNAAALALQPGHPGLLNNAVIIARQAGDGGALIAALESLAASGLVYDLSTLDLSTVAPERVAAVQARFAANAAPAGTAELVANAPLADALIEALAVDDKTEALFLGSVADRKIYRIEPFAPDRPEVFAGEAETLGSIFGLAIDPVNGLLYAAEGAVPQTPRGEDETIDTALVALDLVTGEIVRRHTIDGAARIGDVVVRDGVVYASDAEAGRIYRLDGPRADLEVFAEDARFASLQGLVPTRGSVYAVDYALGVWRIDTRTRQARLLPAPEGASLIGLDGLAADRAGRLFVVRNGAEPYGLFELELDRDGNPSALTPVLTGDARLAEPVTARLVDGRAFLIADAQWRRFPEDGSAPPEPRTATPILAVDLP
ncbi:MAG: SMP-30/gluconolactonase/LRE family protein [Oceanicaulis sp.]